jgi:hypothetical protein
MHETVVTVFFDIFPDLVPITRDVVVALDPTAIALDDVVVRVDWGCSFIVCHNRTTV